MASCEVCDQLWQFYSTSSSDNDKINLGSFDEALASPCPDHTKIVDAFRGHGGSRSLPESALNNNTTDLGFIRGDRGKSVSLYRSLEKFGLVWELAAIKREDVPHHPGIARVLDPDWVDLGHVSEWKKECFSSHGGRCENPMKIPPVSPAWLIDAKRKCIVPGGDAKTFVALSYRWNGTKGYRLRHAAISALQQERSLEAAEVWNQIPLIIRHAISLTEATGEQYLWADALCIDHSDVVSTSEQVNLMTAIYAGAVFTIIAADTDAKEGIRGLKNISSPRKLRQKIFPIGEEQLVVRNTGMFDLEHWSAYHERGWTYQEFKMSPRKLLFVKEEAHWLCQCSEWHEELILGSEVDKYIDPRPGVLTSGFPDLGSLGHVLSSYNTRQLSYDEDALAAISGLLTVMSRSFEGGFLYGLPETLFDRALAWEPQWPHTELRKRKPSATGSQIQFAATDLPSWSWLGWQGMVSFRYGEAARINDAEWQLKEVTPITEWYTSASPTDQPRRRIRSKWFEKRSRRKDPNQPMPPGWMRLAAPTHGEFRNEPMMYPDKCGQYVYQHHALPDKDNTSWYYPFPVPDIQTSTPYCIPEQTRYLFCKTWKASVWSLRKRHKWHGTNNFILTLRREMKGDEIGALHLQNKEQVEKWPEPASEDEDDVVDAEVKARKIELVAINECTVLTKTFSQEHKRYDLPINREERVTVLWVEWEDGIAYRLACGYVDKEAWRSLEPEPIDLVMG